MQEERQRRQQQPSQGLVTDSALPCNHEDSHYFYRAALALNNMAVTMLERHCYKQAFLTLKDAVFCMMVASKQQPQPPTHKNYHKPEQGEQLKEILQKASQRAARPESASSSFSALSAWLSIQAIWDTDPTTTCLLSLQHDPEDSSKVIVVRPIRMDDLGMYNLDTMHPNQSEDADATGQYQDSDLYTSIILYNFGLAHYCRSRQTILMMLHHQNYSSHHNASNYLKNHQNLLEHALKILGLSRQMILAAGCDNSNDDPDRNQSAGGALTEDSDWLVSSRRLLVSTLVLHIRARIYTELQQQQQSPSSILPHLSDEQQQPPPEIHWQQRAHQCRQQVQEILTLLWMEQRRMIQLENHNLSVSSPLTTIFPSLFHALERPVAAERWNDDRSSHLWSSASQNSATMVLAAAA